MVEFAKPSLLRGDCAQRTAVAPAAVFLIGTNGDAVPPAIDQIIAPLERSSVQPSVPWVGEEKSGKLFKPF